MKWYENWLEVFKIGTHTDSAGNTREWTQEDLDTIVKNYDPKEQEAPVVLGHPKTDEPAYAWVLELRTEGGILFAKLDKVDPEFALWVEKGLYRKISIALDADLNLRHVGFLGAANPAVKGLCNDFSDGEDLLLISENFVSPARGAETFYSKSFIKTPAELRSSQSSNTHCAGLITAFASLNELISGKTCDAPSTTQNAWGSLHFAKNSGNASQGGFGTSEKNNKENTMFKKQSQQDFAAKAAELERELELAAVATQRAEFSSFLGGLQAQAKITAEDKIGLEQVFEILLAVDAMEFSSSEKVSNDASAATFMDFLSALPPRVELKELATRENALKGTYRTPQEELGMKIAGAIKKS